jgi:hypothetical protein
VTVLASRISGTLGTTKITLAGTAQVRIVESADDMGALRGTRAVTGTTDALAQSDLGGAVTYSNAASIAASIAQAGASGAFLDGWSVHVKNTGAGTLTITPTTSTINGGATLVLPTNMGAFIWSDGTNYHAYFMPVTKPLSGPGTSTDNAAARYDLATGTIIQDSALIIADTTGALSRTGGGGIPVQATNTNNDAAAGYVGEFKESEIVSGSAVSMTSGVAANITSLSLEPGDWWVCGNFAIQGFTSTVYFGAAFSATSAPTFPTSPNKGGMMFLAGDQAGSTWAVPGRRFLLTSTTTIYLIGNVTFTGTGSGYGYICARRVR